MFEDEALGKGSPNLPDQPTPYEDLPSRDHADTPPPARRWRRLIKPLLVLAVVALALYYPVGMILVHRINDDATFEPSAEFAVEGGSRAVAMTAALIDREVNHTPWVPNSPFFLPSAALDNMPAFQAGLKTALFRFAIEMTDQLGRTRGSSQVDPDLDAAAGELKFPGDVWLWAPSISLLPTASSEQHFRRAIELLQRYNRRLAAGQAVYERRGDNLMATLDRIALDLGSASAEIDSHVRDHGGLFDFQADNLFYNVKGRLHGYRMIIRALGQDFASVIGGRDLDSAWAQMLDSIDEAAGLRPMVVINGAPDSMVLPSHLVAQGFYLMRARTQLREITNILLK
jgi:hypothetical protein